MQRIYRKLAYHPDANTDKTVTGHQKIEGTTPVSNVIRSLRTARGWTMEQLAEAIGATISTINRIEKGEVRLVSDWVPKLAAVLGVSEAEIAGLGTAPPGLSEDATPFVADPGHPLERAAFGPSRDIWVVTSDALDAIGLYPGDKVVLDRSPAAVDAIATGDAVIVQIVDRDAPLRTTALLRQFVEPDLFITNARDHNAASLNRRHDDVRVLGVVVHKIAKVGRR